VNTIFPECRFCGFEVRYFGEICGDCREAETSDQRDQRESYDYDNNGLGPCGCNDYHYADCPTRGGS